MNRALRNMHNRRTSYRKSGGGLSVGPNVLVPFDPKNDWNITTRAFENQTTPDCYDIARPGALATPPNPALAQTAMAGGGCCGASGSLMPKMLGGRTRRNGCGMMRGGRRSRRSNCGMMRGGGNGFATVPGYTIGGNGPNVAALYSPVPCDIRAGSDTSTLPQVANPDPRAPADLYSLTANSAKQSGGAYSTPNAYGPECYKAPGSSLPVYNAETAGFHFEPSTEKGGALPDGVTPYNNVVAHAARLGGGYKRKHRKSYKGRKGRKGSRKTRRSHRK
jgi:hypothetical protein